jgi:hypothetical protein
MSDLTPRQTLAIGAAAGAVTFGAWLGLWFVRNRASIESGSEAFAEQVAQATVRAYMADRVGLTDERLAGIRRLVDATRGRL